MFVDRTAFESSYYVAEYAKLNPIKPEEQFWYDKIFYMNWDYLKPTELL